MEGFQITPDKVMEALSKRVHGQDYAKYVLSVGVYKHLLRLEYPELELGKSNIVMVGPTGCGKTELIRTLKEFFEHNFCDVPVYIADGSNFTEVGVRGPNPQDVLGILAKKYGVKKTQQAIIYFDEFDKKCVDNRFSVADQYSLLKMLEGTKVDMEGEEGEEKFTVDTSNILFILGGAFSGIEKVIAKRLEQDGKNVGLNKPAASPVFGLAPKAADKPKPVTYNEVIEKIEPADLLAYGMAREVMGRLSSVAYLKALTADDFEKITENYFYQEYFDIFRNEGMRPILRQEAIEEISHQAEVLHLGARAIKSILEPVIFGLLFENVGNLPTDKRKLVYIDRQSILKYIKYKNAC